MQPRTAGWYPDPYARFEYRWHDGAAWTATVGHRGRPVTDPRGTDPGHVPRALADPGWLRRGVKRQVRSTGGGGRRPARRCGLLDADVLVIGQKAKLVELTNEYMIYDEHGVQVGAVREIGQSMGRKALRATTGLDQYLSHCLEITGTDGAAVLRLTRPATLLRSTVQVEGPAGQAIGTVVHERGVGRPRFSLRAAGGALVGRLHAEGWRVRDVHIEDAAGTEVGRITRSRGDVRSWITTADSYVLRVPTTQPEPLRTLVLAAAVSVDLSLRQSVR